MCAAYRMLSACRRRGAALGARFPVPDPASDERTGAGAYANLPPRAVAEGARRTHEEDAEALLALPATPQWGRLRTALGQLTVQQLHVACSEGEAGLLRVAADLHQPYPDAVTLQRDGARRSRFPWPLA
jgi:hypothetical protein